MKITIIRLCVLSLLSLLSFQDPSWVKQVMRKHPNGKPYVIMYFDKDTNKMMREEVFFSNGKLQWEGNYKNDLEDGKWVYYYESGVVKSEQMYTKGKENGTCLDYNAQGKLVKESHWVHGKEVKVIKH